MSKALTKLTVPYFYQYDNKSGTGYRECFSSSCAMLAAYLGKVESDDEYNLIRQHYGDTTSSTAQLGALSRLGLHPFFLTNGTAARLKAEIDKGYPVAVGWIHKGRVSAPTGGGHWSVVVGYDDIGFLVHDPSGEADMVHGGYVNYNKGEYIHYSYKNWLKRWEIDGPGTGWYLTVRP